MIREWIRMNRGECPICGGKSKGCRESGRTGLIFCRDRDANPPSYKYLHDDPWGFGIWQSVEDAEEFNKLNQEERERQRREYLTLEEQRRREQIANELPAVERDRHYREILRQLELNESDRIHLAERGFEPEEITLYRSVEPWQRVNGNFPKNLPGLLPGNVLNVSGEAILIPVIDHQGYIVALQIRLKNTEGGRYRWLTSANTKNPNGARPHLGGELPVGVYDYSTSKSDAIWLTEGYLKPDLASQKFGIPMIGVASGRFDGSPKAALAAVEVLATKHDTKKLIFPIDGGDVLNQNGVPQRWEKQYQFFTERGYDCCFAWWGQFTKENCDVDELDSLAEVQFISLEEFKKLVPATGRKQGSDGTITREEWKQKRDLEDFLKTLTSKASQGFNFIKSGFTKHDQKGVNPSTQTHNQDIDLYFEAEDRKKTYIYAAKKGYKYVLDLSHAGAGKTHAIADFTPEDFKTPNKNGDFESVEKLFYISNEHRNPTVEGLEGWRDLPVRNSGLVADGQKPTSSGRPSIRWPKAGEEPNIVGNCHRTPLFHALANKGYAAESSSEAAINPICNTCKLRGACRGQFAEGNEGEPNARVPGASFRRDRRDAMQSDRIRSHINSLPQPEDIKKSIAFVDEASRQLQPVETVSVSWQDFDRAMMDLQSKAPEIYEQIKGVLGVRSLLTGEIPITQETYHGYSDNVVRQYLGEIPENLSELIAEVEALRPNIEDLIEEADSVSLDGVEGDKKSVDRGTLRYIRSKMSTAAIASTHRNIENLLVNWLAAFLSVIGGITPGALRVKNNRLEIATRNTRHVDALKAFQTTFFMDGTATRESLALLLGCEPHEIFVISQIPPKYDNLTIVQVTSLGLCGKDRSELMKQRVTALSSAIEEKHKKVGVIDHLSTKAEGQGHWFADNRGSNAYLDCDAMLLLGTPFQDIGALALQYTTLTGDRNTSRENPRFQSFVDHHVRAEVIQGVGRLRANRRPDAQLFCYAACEKELGYVVDYFAGATLTQVDAFQITPRAGTDKQQTRWEIFQAFRSIYERKGKITQEAIAKLAGCSQELISKISKQFGGWKVLKNLLLLLYNSLYTASNKFLEDLSQDERWLLAKYLPLLKTEYEAGEKTAPEIVEEIMIFTQHLGWKGFQRVIESLPLHLRSFLLECLIAVLPPEILEQVRRDVLPTG